MKYRRKKKEKLRGSSSHGYGSRKKHRGSGNRAGRGLAGTGKGSDSKKPSILKLYGNAYYGKHGFKRPQKILKKLNVINISDLPKFNKIEINLTELGYDKLLGKGTPDKKYKIKVGSFSQQAKEKIEKAGGMIE